MRPEDKVNTPSAVDTSALARAIARIAPTDGDYNTALPALTVHRRKAATAPMHCLYGLGLGVTVQGAKQVMVADEVLSYAAGQSMLSTVDLPVVSHVTRASVSQPFLGLMLLLNSTTIMRIAAEMQLPQPPKDCVYRPITVQTLDAATLDALVRLVDLLDEAVLLPQLAPLIQDEIIVRLLTGPHGPQLRHIVTAGSPSQQIAKAVAWLKLNFCLPLRMDELAARAHMSPSTFRQHFRAVTGISPLQYQKQLRLQQARQLMLSENVDAGSAGDRVGYVSPSQFSREYSRLFGEPPQRDIKRMRVH